MENSSRKSLEQFREEIFELERNAKKLPRKKARPPFSVLVDNGETCRTCQSAGRFSYSRAFYKCLKNEEYWTGGTATDIRLNDPACSEYKKIEE